MPFGSLPFFSCPPRTVPHCLDAFPHAEAVHLEVIAAHITGFHHVLETKLDGIHADLFRYPIQLLLPCGPGDHSSVAPLCTAGGLVGVNAIGVILHVLETIGPSEKRTCIVDGGYSKTAVGSPFQVAFVLEGQDGAVFLDPCCQGVDELVSCPAVEKDLFSCEAHLDRLSGFHGHEAGRHLHGIGRDLGTESAAHVRLDHSELSDGNAEHHGDGPLHVMRGLGAAPKGQVSVRVIFGYAPLRFDERPILPFVPEGVGPDHIALSQSRFHISELLVDLGADVAQILVVHKRRPFCHGLFQAQDRGQFLILHLDEGQGFHGRLQVDGRHCSHLVSRRTGPCHGRKGFRRIGPGSRRT